MFSTFSNRRLPQLCASLFALSTMFPIAASVYPPDPPRWLGGADVGVAALLLTAAIALAMRIQAEVIDDDRVKAFRASQVVISAIPVLLVLFFIFGAHIKWDVLVIGLAWRGWLLIYSLPYLISAQRTGPRLRSSPH